MSFVTIHEVGPRDGLQNEPRPIPLMDKRDFVLKLLATGLKRIEVGSLVSPKWVPQMANSRGLLALLPDTDGIYDVLVPNMRGWRDFEAAYRPKTTGVSLFVAASEGFSQSNLSCSIDESFQRIVPVVAAAQEAGVPLRAYVSCVTDCPFDGPVAPEAVAQVAERLYALARCQISLGETIGKGTPDRVARMIETVADVVPVQELAGHFHDTGGRAIENIEAALACGIHAFDAAAGGLGGCPYAPGAPGNVATEAVVAHLHSAGFETGLDEAKLADAAAFARSLKEGEAHDQS